MHRLPQHRRGREAGRRGVALAEPARGANDTGLIGKSIRRKEDARFLTGTGQYTDDVVLPRQTYAVFLRSPHAHARIRSIDTKAALASPGVVAVHPGPYLQGVGGLPSGWR